MNHNLDTFSTSAGMIAVERAQLFDVDDIVAILTGAVEWLTAKGINQWQPGRFSREGSAAAVERGEVFVARLGKEAVGTLRLLWSDDSLWDARPGKAGYVHALGVKRAYADHQIGIGLLRWAEGQVVAAEKEFLRLDCTAANLALRSYYLNAGFMFVGEVQKHGWVAALFEREAKPIGEISA